MPSARQIPPVSLTAAEARLVADVIVGRLATMTVTDREDVKTSIVLNAALAKLNAVVEKRGRQ